MNKPPEKLREGKPGQRIVYIGNGFLPSYEDFQRAFILEEENPMTQKTGNLTTEEAWAAMARGECVKCGNIIRRIKSGNEILQAWDGNYNGWSHSVTLGSGPYSIVPDPSKPKEVEDNSYDKRAENFINRFGTSEGKQTARAMLSFIKEEFQRKP